MNDNWRYRCPDCGSPSLRSITKSRRAPGNYPAGAKGARQSRQSRAKGYYCNSCNERKAKLRDMKQGCLTRRANV